MTIASIPLRAWATPLTIGSVLLMTGTGILMFFEWDRGLMFVVHQWFSWLFVIGAGGHIAANLRPFKSHLKSRWGAGSLVAFTIVMAASFQSWGYVTGPQLQRPIEEALVDAPLWALAGVAHADPAEIMGRLKARGIAADSQETVRALSGKHGVGENRLLAIVFLHE